MTESDPMPLADGTSRNVTQDLLKQLQRHPKRVVFTDGEDIRVLRAAARLVALEAVVPVLLGNRETIRKLAEEHSVPLDFIKIINPPESSDFELFCKRLENMARYRSVRGVDAAELVSRPHYFGALMVQYGHADAMVGGNRSLPAAFFRAVMNTIKPLAHVPRIFCVTILQGPHLSRFGEDGILFLADTGMNAQPDVRQLASFAIETGKLARHFLRRRPTIAMLSYSTLGSAATPGAVQMAAATSLARDAAVREFLDFDILGEIQADVALDPLAAEIKIPGADVRKPADVLIFPNLDAANISSKLLSHVAGAQVSGPLIMGISRPCAQVARTCSEESIFTTAAAVAVEAIKYHELDFPDEDRL